MNFDYMSSVFYGLDRLTYSHELTTDIKQHVTEQIFWPTSNLVWKQGNSQKIMLTDYGLDRGLNSGKGKIFFF